MLQRREGWTWSMGATPVGLSLTGATPVGLLLPMDSEGAIPHLVERFGLERMLTHADSPFSRNEAAECTSAVTWLGRSPTHAGYRALEARTTPEWGKAVALYSSRPVSET